MSFARSFEESRSIQNMIQCDKTDGMDDAPSSPILHGSATPGTTETVHTTNVNTQTKDGRSEMSQIRTNLKVRTGSLTRKYASTGS